MWRSGESGTTVEEDTELSGDSTTSVQVPTGAEERLDDHRTEPFPGAARGGSALSDTVYADPTSDRTEPFERPGVESASHLDQAGTKRAITAAPSESGQLPNGTQLGRFVIEDLVGVGGMGVVYAARDPRLGRRLAVKVLRGGVDLGYRPAARLLREAKAMAKLSHPNVVTVYEADSVGSEIFVAMELINGQTLAEWRRAPHPWRAIVDIFVEAGRGLEAAHKAGIVHRDFKPENVLIDTEGRVRVSDFGLAREVRRLSPDTPTGNESEFGGGPVLGTPLYMSPEQHLGRTVDARSDQWSFCVALYETLYGKHPFASLSYVELSERVTRGKRHKPPPGVRLPGWLRRVLKRGMATSPRDRFPDMGALLAELERDHSGGRRVLVGAAAVVLIAGVSLLVARPRESIAGPCNVAGRGLDAVWNPTRKAAIASTFAATGVGFADSAWSSAAQRLDEYGLAVTRMEIDSCQATHVRHVQSGELAEARALCLANRRLEMSALIDLFARADASVVEHAVEATRALPAVAACANARALRAVTAMPSDPAVAQQIAAARHELSTAAAWMYAGGKDDGQDRTEAAVRSARAIGHAPLLAQALVIAGRVDWQGGHFKAARRNLVEAVSAAERGQDDLTKAHALVWLVAVAGSELAEFGDAQLFADLAAAALERAGGDESLRSLLAEHVGATALARGDAEAAMTAFQQALELRENSNDTDGGALGLVYLQLGSAERELDHLDDAMAHEVKGRELIETAFGAGHPYYATALNEIANVYVAMGDLPKARALYDDAMKRLRAAQKRPHPELAITLANLGTVSLMSHDVDQAIALYREALAIEESTLGEDNPRVAATLTVLGIAYRERGSPGAAEAAHQRALNIRMAAFGEEHPLVGESSHLLGQLELERGDLFAASNQLERALRLVTVTGAPSDQVGDIRFELAEALWRTGDHKRAHSLAAQAVRDLDRAGSDRTSEVRAWLAAPH